MNCAQHTETAAVAYCRTCGKALCETCRREVQGTIFCESCLAARINLGSSGNFGSAGNYGSTGYGAAGGYPPPRAPEDASPGLALFLGFIPGVGAFYNGQFLKGFVHVIVMSTLIWMSHHGMGGFAGLLIAAWVFYMVFDAWSTAKARRYGQPIPDPLGLNAILEGREGTFRQRVEQAGERLGTHVEYAAQNIGQHWHQAGGAAPSATTSNFAPGEGASNPAAPPPPPGGAYGNPANEIPNPAPDPGAYYAAPGYVAPRERERGPVSAIVLIGFGLLFLMANLGWFSFHWVSHFWPLILIAIGLWLFIKRQRDGR